MTARRTRGAEERLGLLGPRADEPRGCRSDVAHTCRVEIDNLVVPEIGGVRRDVLLAHQARPVAEIAEDLGDVPLRMVEPIAPVRQAEHPCRVGALAGKQRSPRARADRGGTEGLAEERTLVGEVLDVRRRHRVAVWLHIAAGVMRMQIENIGSHSSLW
jgi:hypothetical protein